MRKVIHSIIFEFCVLFCLAIAAIGQEPQVTTIHVVTPEWEGYTEQDGTGVYFDLVRAVYEPVGVVMTYEIVP